MAPLPMTPSPSDHILPVLCSALALILLCGLCALCKRRRKRRMRNICPNGVALVDVTLLRQTQLRSLSKSDTKLHEIKRPRLVDPQLRPVSMDPLYSSPNWQLPAATSEEDVTYSNLNYPPAPLKTSLYEFVGSRTEMENAPSESQADEVTAEYAVVCKMKKKNARVQESKKEKKTPTQTPSDEPNLPHRPDDLEIEEMYSKVNKKKKTVRDDPRVSTNPPLEHLPPTNKAARNEKAQGSKNSLLDHHPQPEENLYESICEMTSHAL